MSDALGFNKIAFCVLGTGLALIGFSQASAALFHETHHEKEGYKVEVPLTAEGGATTAAVEGPRDYNKLISAADPVAGQLVATKCKQCHDFEPNGKVITGPPLYGVIGRKIASMSFKYSEGPGSMAEHGEQVGTWTYENFDRYIENPKKLVPKTAMNFFGLKKQVDRSNLMAWLRTQTTGEPLPLPPPLPDAPAAPADGATPPADGAAPAPAPANGAAPTAPVPVQPAPAAPH